MRIVLAPVDEDARERGSQVRQVVSSTPHWVGTGPVARAPTGIGGVPLNVLSVLRSIRPEHVEEINYVDCVETVDKRPNSGSSVYVVLKRGAGFEPGLGSVVRTVAPQATARVRADTGAGRPVPRQP